MLRLVFLALIAIAGAMLVLRFAPTVTGAHRLEVPLPGETARGAAGNDVHST